MSKVAAVELLDHLNSVTTIPIIPFRNEQIDFEAHRTNIRYLMQNNHLSDGRPRVICVAGTSLIHHLDPVEQTRLLQITADTMGDEGILISALMPNPLKIMQQLTEEQLDLHRPPDAFLIMPMVGIYTSGGLYTTLMKQADRYGPKDAKFIFYHRNQRDSAQVIQLIRESPHFIGVKVGTSEEDVPKLVEEIGESGIVIWGKGDRSTKAAQLGSKGHTSGISVLYAKAGDLINNAQREGDYDRSQEIEKRVAPLEELRFENGRENNYTAVVEAMILSGFLDIDAGEGGPFNPRVSAEVSERVQAAIRNLEDLH
ncbi:MAG: dihydrodipicolinate synthase family protein [Saprospiraceae bacterium]|nr:dihydrodipicolinate synthase family protein [Saprospiraceae bacterium]